MYPYQSVLVISQGGGPRGETLPPTPSNFLGSASLVRKFRSQKTDRLGWLGLGDYDTDLNVDVELVLVFRPKTILPKGIWSTRCRPKHCFGRLPVGQVVFDQKSRNICGIPGSFENPYFIASE